MTVHEKYQEAIAKLNEKNANLQQRVNRCSYLKQRLDKMVACRNREQAEAYTQRINWHKPKLLEALEEIEILEEKISLMPKEYIV